MKNLSHRPFDAFRREFIDVDAERLATPCAQAGKGAFSSVFLHFPIWL